MMWGYGFSWGGMLLNSVIWIALLAVVAWAIIRWVNGKVTNAPPLYYQHTERPISARDSAPALCTWGD